MAEPESSPQLAGFEATEAALLLSSRRAQDIEDRQTAIDAARGLEGYVEPSISARYSRAEQAHLFRTVASCQKDIALKFRDWAVFALAVQNVHAASRVATPDDKLDDRLNEIELLTEGGRTFGWGAVVDEARHMALLILITIGALPAAIGAKGQLSHALFLLKPIRWHEELDFDAAVRCCMAAGECLFGRFLEARMGLALDEAIQFCEAVLPPFRFNSEPIRDNATFLAYLRLRRYGETGSVSDVERALDVARRAVREIPEAGFPAPQRICVLVAALLAHFRCRGPRQSLEEARSAAESVHQSSHEVVFRDLNLASLTKKLDSLIRFLDGRISAPDGLSVEGRLELADCFISRFDLARDPADLEAAVLILEDPSSDQTQLTAQLKLGQLLHARFVDVRNATDLGKAQEIAAGIIDKFAFGGDEWAQAQLLLGDCLLPAFLEEGGYTPAFNLEDEEGRLRATAAGQAYRAITENAREISTRVRLDGAVRWREVAVNLHRVAEAARASCFALEFIDDFLKTKPCRFEIAKILSRLEFLLSRAAYSLARVGDLAGAVALIEGGRSLLDYEMDPTADQMINPLFSDLASYGKQIAKTYETHFDSGNDLWVDLAGSAEAYATASWQFQVRNGSLAASPVRTETVRACTNIAEGSGIAWLVAGTYGLVIALPPGGSLSVRFILHAGENDVRRRVDILYKSYLARRADYAVFEDILSKISLWLGGTFGGALAMMFESGQHLFIAAAGLISLLPMASALVKGKASGDRDFLIDRFSISTLSSVQIIKSLRTRLREVVPGSAVVVQNPKSDKYRALIFAHLECGAVQGTFGVAEVLSGEDATTRAAMRAIASADVLHFSSHGINRWGNPHETGLLLAGDDMLKAEDINSIGPLPHAPRLIFLSACDSAAVSRTLSDEAIGLPKYFLRMGVCGVVGTLWAVNELSALFMVLAFYSVWTGFQQSPAAALRAAQRWVRDTTNREKLDALERRLPQESTSRPEYPGLRDLLLRAPDDKSFAHPLNWAPFVVSGV
jgi:hypothetical protein